MGSLSVKAQEQITPYALEVCHNSTTHIIFPNEVAYIDLGSPQIIAATATGAENVVRVKSASEEGFAEQTNMSVITDNGSFYTFCLRYSENPESLSVEMVDFIHNGSSVNRPSNALEVYLEELGEESPKGVQRIMRSIYEGNRRFIKGASSHCFDIQYSLRSIYINEGMLYFNIELRNDSNINFDIDYTTMKIVDRKVAKRTAMQEQIIEPLRAYNNVTRIEGKGRERVIFALKKFTIPNDKNLIIELHERDGGRHQRIKIRNREILNARTISKLK